MLDKHYCINSEKRMDMLISVLKKYEVDYLDESKINALIERAEEDKVK